ncbi:receptor-like protein 12 [Cinnamomum micranthum f. kanehirae]|uniref:Receptor-like protein 12 n=1 Tax=Cinnamomum micranthum f. kanehirae TaxID=337451 RepID=A0A3S3M8C3_9MAGN|nr:receptor-like protein 12 [Cinnamomum micranthum f. kanehirae]
MKLPLFFQFLSIFSILVSTNPTSAAQCLEDQKSSLLTLFGSAHPPSWTPNTDCCNHWEGITCDGSTGHVTGLGLPNHWIVASINFTSLISLSSLRNLDLSNNFFSNSSIPTSISALSNLTHLNLSNSYFTGYVPVEISRIKSLESLDLSSSFSFFRFRRPDFEYVVGNLSGLRELYLDNVDISSPAPESLAGLANLRSLHLSWCNLSGAFPVEIFQLRDLETLDLSYNPHLTGTIPSSLGGISQLLHLDISYNSFSGEIQSLENLTQLIRLDLSSNRFSGRIPSLGSLKNVIEIVLSNNNFSGRIDYSFGENGLLNLTKLDLRDNSLNGKIPSSLFWLPSLLHLDLSQNHFDAPFDEFGNTPSPLEELDLSNNKLQGPIPKSLFHLVGLRVLVLSSNNFSGIVDLSSFQHFKNLSDLYLSNINLSINASRGTSTSFPQITSLKLSSCNLREFPEFLRNQSKLNFLDLSSNQIDGEIPSWIWTMGGGLYYLNLSHNMLYGPELHTVDLSLSKLIALDLHSNKLQGMMPIPPPSIAILDYSHNNFTSIIPANISVYLNFTGFFSLSENNISGEIPPSICAAKNLVVLDLSLNNLSGSIPTCLGQLNKLLVLNLGKNSFRGVIPHSFRHGCSLRTLNLNGNLLEGSLPQSLANCTQLEVLNIGNNLIKDSFPSWLGSLKQLRILILRSNKFFGPIQHPEDQNAFSRLQIIDVSLNDFMGNLSSEFFRSLKAMMDGEFERRSFRSDILDLNRNNYQESVGVTLKGLEMEFLNSLYLLTAIDLSNNKFQGSIPDDIGNLKSLNTFNMSRNEFTGSIPSSFGNLTQLESLDLSRNNLSGGIPTELTSLTFLAVLNLSYNRLMGRIPQARQFLTFGNDSFQGNAGLCGPPLSMQCDAPGEPRSANLPSRKHFDWRYMCIGLGFGFGNWMVMGPIIFWPRGRLWYYKHVDKILAMATVWWDEYGMRMTVLTQRAYDRVRHTLLRR